MKFAIVLLVIAFAATLEAAATNTIDWFKVKPLYVLPQGLSVDDSAVVPDGRITNGNLAEAKQFPYQVGLMLYLEGGSAWCGGSVISNRWVLTAAHCTEDVTTGVDVYLGAWNRLDRTEKNQQIIFASRKYIIVHEHYDSTLITNDISLIKTPVVIEFNEYIQPIALPKFAATYPTYDGEMAIASGWGRISDEAAGATDKLRWVEVPIMKNSACNIYYLGSIQSSNICIKTTDKKSTCNGDSGGPLVLADSTPHVLVGLTSFGLALGCEVGWPGVFTRVTSYLDWIESHTGITHV